MSPRLVRVSVALVALVAPLAAPAAAAAQDRTPEENKAVVRRFVEEAFNRRNLAVFDTLVAPDLKVNGREIGRDGFRRAVAELHRTWRDLRTEIRFLVAEGDLVAAYLEGSGTHAGPFAGIPPTGRRVRWKGTVISRIRDGKIQERWSVFDWTDVLQQLTAPARPDTRN